MVVPGKPINKGFSAYLQLFKLNRPWWFARQIIEYSIDSLYLIDDPAHYFLQYFERNIQPPRLS